MVRRRTYDGCITTERKAPTMTINLGQRYVNIVSNDGRPVHLHYPFTADLTDLYIAAHVARQETGDTRNANQYTVTDATPDGRVSLMARHVVVGDVMPFSGGAITDIYRHRDGVRITLSDGSWFWRNDSSLMNVVPVGPRPKHQNAPQRPAPGFRPLEPIEPASAPQEAAQAAHQPVDVDHVNCTHGRRLQGEGCADCEAAEDTPHPYNGVNVRNPRTRKIVSRCQDCGLSVGYFSHIVKR
jgi:hypothetical protein